MTNRNEHIKNAFRKAAADEYNELTAQSREMHIPKPKTKPVRRLNFRRILIAAVIAVFCLSLCASVTAITIRKGSETTWDWSEKKSVLSSLTDGSNPVDTDEDLTTVVYNGKKVVIKLSYDGGDSDYDQCKKALFVNLDSVRQTITLKTPDGKTSTGEFLMIDTSGSEHKTFEISFTPNIGKKGEELQLSLCMMARPELEHPHKLLSAIPSYSLISTCGKLIMKKDAPTQEKICASFSGTEVTKTDDRIYKSYDFSDGVNNDNDYKETRGIYLYKDISESIYYEDGVLVHNTDIKVKKSKKTKIKINLHGKPGKYRICLSLNNELLPVFDGARYTDVTVEKDKQTVLTVELDTTALSGENSLHVIRREFAPIGDMESLEENSLPYRLIVK
ncbi:MAG: hypothetical protein ACI4XE_04285 [Acutalibacteraceae bacterium]